MKKYLVVSIASILFSGLLLSVSSYFFRVPFSFYNEGEVLDSLNGVYVFYNGSTSHIEERNISDNGYNVGLKWQCVEFVKRYYLDVYNHEMSNSHGNAVDFYNAELADGVVNPERGLVQYSNPFNTKPREGDILVFNGGYGHVAIVSSVTTGQIEIIQQNVYTKTRAYLKLSELNNIFRIDNPRVLGRLRLSESLSANDR